MDTEETYSPSEAARILRLSKRRVIQLIITEGYYLSAGLSNCSLALLRASAALALSLRT